MNAPSAAAAAPAAPRRTLPGRALRVLGAWLVLEIVLVALAVGWVAVHSHLVDPGHPAAHYEAYARRATPVVAVVLSGPVFAAFGFLCGRRRGREGAAFARTTTAFLLAFDAAFVAVAAGASGGAWLAWFAAGVFKVAGAVLGGRLGARAADPR